MNTEMKPLTDFLLGLGIGEVAHTGRTYLAHLIGVYRLMGSQGCDAELCRAGCSIRSTALSSSRASRFPWSGVLSWL